MAQYGRNFYGASYYGISGVFSGQFMSDKTALSEPLKYDATKGLDGTIKFNITANLSWVNYSYENSFKSFPEYKELHGELANDIYRYSGVWTDTGTSYITSDPNFKVETALVCSDMKINFVNRVDGAIIDLKIYDYISGTLNSTPLVDTTVDTSIEQVYAISDLPFKEYLVVLTINSASVNPYFEFLGTEAIVNDISLEFKNTLDRIDVDAGWGSWVRIDLTREYSQENQNYVFRGTTSDISGSQAYQFKLLLATSDNQVSPEILETDVYTSNVDHYEDEAYWQMLIDLGANFSPDLGDTIETIRYDADIPDDSVLEIRTRTTDDPAAQTEEGYAISWDYWSAPYSKADKRALIDLKGIDFSTISENEINNGYIGYRFHTNSFIPENLTNWKEIIPKYFINDRDPYYLSNDVYNSGTRRDSYIKIDFLHEHFGPILKDNKVYSFIIDSQSYNEEEIKREIGDINKPIRLRVTIYVKVDDADTNYPFSCGTPAIDGIYLSCNAEYTEIRRFGKRDPVTSTLPQYNPNEVREDIYWDAHKNQSIDVYEAFGSSVFNDNGIDYVYTDGKARANFASITNFGFTIPVGVTNPEYIVKEPKVNEGTSGSVFVDWEGNSVDTDNGKLTLDQSDKLMVEVKENDRDTKKHRHYGSGITLKIDDLNKTNRDENTISNVFYPPLDTDKINASQYAFSIRNGFDDESYNGNVDIRWSGENTKEPAPETVSDPSLYRRNISTSKDEKVYVSIIKANKGGIVKWISEELIVDGTLNEDSPITSIDDSSYPKTSPFPIDKTELPEIPEDVIIVDDNPYKAEIVHGSVTSEQQKKETSRINLEIIGLHYDNEDTIARDVKLIKSSTDKDYFFRPNTSDITSIRHADQGANSTQYAKDIHFTLDKENKVIDWSLAVINGLAYPNEGDELLVTYTYKESSSLIIHGMCDYNRRYYDRASIFKTHTLLYHGRCSHGRDYISPEYDINVLWPNLSDSIDKTTLKLKVRSVDNNMVNLYVEDNKVVGTLGTTNPRENWYPSIKNGFYNIGKNNYFLFSNPKTISLSKSTVPFAENVEYTQGVIDEGLLIQSATNNLIGNSKFNTSKDQLQEGFSDTFER